MKRVAFLLFFSFTFVFANDYDAYFERVDVAVNTITTRYSVNPKLLIILSEGIDGPLNKLKNKVEMTSIDIPAFPEPFAEGNEGKYFFGKLNGTQVVIMKDYSLYYEGLNATDAAFPYFVFNKLGVKAVITLHSAVGVQEHFKPGSVMLVDDHVNLIGDTSLLGLSICRQENRFARLIKPYSFENIAEKNAKKLGIKLKSGVYSNVSCPGFETSSEIKVYRQMGIDAVGMANVFEVNTSLFLDMKVLAFANITSSADDDDDDLHAMTELNALKVSKSKLNSLITACAEDIASSL